MLALPVFAFAGTGINGLFTASMDLLNNIVLFLISLAIVWFIWNVIKYTMTEQDGGKEKAKGQMIWGIVAIAVIVSIWGVVAILQNIFGTDGAGRVKTYSELEGMIRGP